MLSWISGTIQIPELYNNKLHWVYIYLLKNVLIYITRFCSTELGGKFVCLLFKVTVLFVEAFARWISLLVKAVALLPAIATTLRVQTGIGHRLILHRSFFVYLWITSNNSQNRGTQFLRNYSSWSRRKYCNLFVTSYTRL